MNGITAKGGRDPDFPEDVMGGLKVALRRLSWRCGVSRVGLCVT